jgi:hypothetical protein
LFSRPPHSTALPPLRTAFSLACRGFAEFDQAIAFDCPNPRRGRGIEETYGVAAPYGYEEPALEEATARVHDRADETELADALASGRSMTESDAATYALATATGLTCV